MKGTLQIIGLLIFIAAFLTIIFGLLCLLVGAISGNKKTIKTSGYILLYGSLGLLVSFTLCSAVS